MDGRQRRSRGARSTSHSCPSHLCRIRMIPGCPADSPVSVVPTGRACDSLEARPAPLGGRLPYPRNGDRSCRNPVTRVVTCALARAAPGPLGWPSLRLSWPCSRPPAWAMPCSRVTGGPRSTPGAGLPDSRSLGTVDLSQRGTNDDSGQTVSRSATRPEPQPGRSGVETAEVPEPNDHLWATAELNLWSGPGEDTDLVGSGPRRHTRRRDRSGRERVRGDRPRRLRTLGQRHLPLRGQPDDQHGHGAGHGLLRALPAR